VATNFWTPTQSSRIPPLSAEEIDMSQALEVTATILNLRSSPAIHPMNIVAKLGLGEVVHKLSQPSPDWLEVKNGHVSGFAAARFLAPVATPPEPPPSVAAPFVPPQVDFLPMPQAALDSTEHRHRPLGLQIRPRAAGQSDASRCDQLHDIVRQLDVEHSARYQRTTQSTYCNIYAYDFCRLAGVYLPRVWWMSKALLDHSRGIVPGIVYAKTVRELTANALFDWLTEWGDEFGWERCHDVNDLQQRVNRGAVGTICAQRKNLSRSGHIVMVVPESGGHAAERVGQTVVRPLQSQAGAKNKAYFVNQWWIELQHEFRAHGFWIHP
jgi:hypothetical protein